MDCGNQFETHRGIDAEPLTVCERCGGRLRKVFHPAGIVFKGSGFYATDSRAKRTGSKEGPDAKKADAKSDSSSDSASGSTSGSDKKDSSSSSGTGDSKGESKRESKKPAGSESSS